MNACICINDKMLEILKLSVFMTLGDVHSLCLSTSAGLVVFCVLVFQNEVLKSNKQIKYNKSLHISFLSYEVYALFI